MTTTTDIIRFDDSVWLNEDTIPNADERSVVQGVSQLMRIALRPVMSCGVRLVEEEQPEKVWVVRVLYPRSTRITDVHMTTIRQAYPARVLSMRVYGGGGAADENPNYHMFEAVIARTPVDIQRQFLQVLVQEGRWLTDGGGGGRLVSTADDTTTTHHNVQRIQHKRKRPASPPPSLWSTASRKILSTLRVTMEEESSEPPSSPDNAS